jgi:hypothetical protein
LTTFDIERPSDYRRGCMQTNSEHLPAAAPWIASYELTRRGLERTLAGITDAEALLAPVPGINPVNWLVGHILLYRDRIHDVLGIDPAWSEHLGTSDPYRSGVSPSAGELSVPLTTLRTELERSQGTVLTKLAHLTAEDLAAAGTPNRTVAEQLALFGAHDLYHVGQIAMVRRLLGKPRALG